MDVPNDKSNIVAATVALSAIAAASTPPVTGYPSSDAIATHAATKAAIAGLTDSVVKRFNVFLPVCFALLLTAVIVGGPVLKRNKASTVGVAKESSVSYVSKELGQARRIKSIDNTLIKSELFMFSFSG